MIATIHVQPGKRRMPAAFCAFVLLLASLTVAKAASGPPQILAQPRNATAREGEQASFSVQVDGSAPLFIQWQRNGEDIPGASGLSFGTTPVTLGNDGDDYSVVVVNSLGTAVSSNALLTVTQGIVVAASANHSGETILYRGWPLVLEVALLHPDAFDSNAVPILISGASGPWFNALRIEIRDSQAQSQSWPFHSAPFTNETVTLDADSGGRMLWWLTPAETALLSLGDFEITATLNTTNVTKPGAWKGLVRSVPITLSISNEPAVLNDAQEEQKRRLFADYALLHGDRVQAQNEINALLSAYPTNIGALTYNAYLKQTAGSFDDAYQAVQLGLEQVALQSPNAAEPPGELLDLEAGLRPIVAPPRVQLTLAGQQVLLSWEGYPFFSYRLEASTDLTAWSTITTSFTISSNRFSAAATLGTGHRFFRVAR